MGAVTAGIDIGQVADPTAIVVTEETERDVDRDDGSRTETVYVVRHAERLALGTAYPDQAARIAEVVHALERKERAALWVVVDSTGVGRPVVDLIREALGRTPVRLSAATFTGTDRIEGRYGSAEIRVGKAWLVSRLQALLQTRRILLPDTEEARALARELLDYELRVTDTATVAAGAFRTGSHDDLATALGLAVLDRGRASRLTGAALAAANDGFTGPSPWNDGAPTRQRPYSSAEMVDIGGGVRWERRS